MFSDQFGGKYLATNYLYIFFSNQGPIEVKFTKYGIHHFNVCAYIQGVQPSSPLFSFKNISSTSGGI